MKAEYLLVEGGRLVGSEKGVLRLEEGDAEALREAAEAEYDLGDFRGVIQRLLILKSGQELELADDSERWGLRALLAAAEDEEHYGLLSRAAQIATWHNNHRFCSRCASPLVKHREDLALHCKGCGLAQYPRISPCIIVLVRRGEQCLLAHAAHFDEGRYSTLAGFIEAGETAEAAVAREIMEEVGIAVKNISYHCSQSWPFPHALMLGYFADYESGEVMPDGKEILDAQWFSVEALPLIPPPFTIARKLMDHFFAQQHKNGIGVVG
ncbi:MAG: NAD(+) diphosphatase [Pontibacterium sp.]